MSHPSTPTIATIQYVPLDKLILSDSNVRRTFRQEGFDELVASIEAHGLLQNLTVRGEHDLQGNTTDRFEVFAGGRRFAALTRLARQKKIARNAPVPCTIREDGIAEELSLVENVVREVLHPADQFEAFKDLHDSKGLGAKEIAARFGVSSRTVKERLRLASVSPNLLRLYREGEMTLDQIMAFTVSDNHARQQEVWDSLGWNKTPETIRRMLTTSHIAADDKRAVFVGREAYEAAGGVIFRDLFADDLGGYFVNPPLLEALAMEKLTALAAHVHAEGWKWVEPAIDFPHERGLARVYARDVELPDVDSARLEVIEGELDAMEADLEAGEDGAETTERHAALVAEYHALQAKSREFDPADIARSGAIVWIGQDGLPTIVRGLLKPEDQAELDGIAEGNEPADDAAQAKPKSASQLSDTLMTDLTAHRTAALRTALGDNPAVALAAVTHALTLKAFYSGTGEHSCLDVTIRSRGLDNLASGIGDSPASKATQRRHEDWAARLPETEADLWDFVLSLPAERALGLLAHVASFAIDAVEIKQHDPDGAGPADNLADALRLDMRDYWAPTVTRYLGRISKPLIVAAVREGVSDEAADRIADWKKAAMAEEAERMLQGKGWLPVVLRPASVNAAENAHTISQAAE